MRHVLRYLWLALAGIVLLKIILWMVMPLLPGIIILAVVIIIFGSLANRRLPF
jgi:hypothetical protein